MNALTIPLPAWLPAESTAHVLHGRRSISWTLTEPGELYRNRYCYAWVELTEGEPWRGEPLRLTAQRRTSPQSYTRQSFTETAREAMHNDVVPRVARYGFDTLWHELSRTPSRYRNAETFRGEAEEALRTARWWLSRADLADMHTAGQVEFRPVPHPRVGERGVSVRVCHPHQQRFSHEQPAAEALVAGERVGWVLSDGALVPTDEGIRQ